MINREITVKATGTLTGSLYIGGNVTSNGAIDMGAAHITGGLTNNSGPVSFAGATIDGLVDVEAGTYSGSSTINNEFDFFGTVLSGSHTINGDVFLASYFNPVTANANLTVNGGSLYVGDNGAAQVALTGNTTMNSPSGSLWLYGSMSGVNNITAGSVWVNPYGSADASTLNGTGTVTANVVAIRGANSMVSGTMTFNVANVFTMYGGTFKGSNTVHGAFTTAAGSHAIVAPHIDAVTAGTLTVVGNVTLDHSTTLNFNLGSPGTSGSGINDLIDITGNLSLDGTLNVNALSGFGAGTYRLFNYTGTLSGAATLLQGTVPPNLTYTIDTSTPGQINLGVATPYIPGDTDHSGGSTLNTLDIDAIYQHFGAASTSQWKVYPDSNPVGQEDVTYEVAHYMLTNYADANLDRYTDFTDFQVLLDHWQAPGGWADGDFNGDGTVDFLDFQVLLDYWNPTGWSAGASQVPEPASLSLLLLGGLAFLRRSRKA